MKKLLLTVLLTLSVFTLTACNNEEEEPFVHNVPEAGNVYLDNLGYYEYINFTNPVVTITVKDIGQIELQLFEEVAPNTVYNFVQYIQNNAYENNQFHRVVTGFVIQGGRIENAECKIRGEFDTNDFDNPLNHTRGVLSMARTNDPNSASSQFFIAHQTNQSTASLDGKYAAFGGVVSGFNVLDYIANLQAEGSQEPQVEIIIENITIDLKGNDYPDPVCLPVE
ncbi:MAG: peptidylprolyl isomerase [Candidatus Izemoplasma sp.]|nr:peptidylprolyl isomerase [Candidatus Izemoplasma sp.]